MDGPRDCHTERSEPEGGKQILYVNTHMWTPVQMILFAKETKTQT